MDNEGCPDNAAPVEPGIWLSSLTLSRISGFFGINSTESSTIFTWGGRSCACETGHLTQDFSSWKHEVLQLEWKIDLFHIAFNHYLTWRKSDKGLRSLLWTIQFLGFFKSRRTFWNFSISEECSHYCNLDYLTTLHIRFLNNLVCRLRPIDRSSGAVKQTHINQSGKYFFTVQNEKRMSCSHFIHKERRGGQRICGKRHKG